MIVHDIIHDSVHMCSLFSQKFSFLCLFYIEYMFLCPFCTWFVLLRQGPADSDHFLQSDSVGTSWLRRVRFWFSQLSSWWKNDGKWWKMMENKGKNDMPHRKNLWKESSAVDVEVSCRYPPLSNRRNEVTERLSRQVKIQSVNKHEQTANIEKISKGSFQATAK